MATGGSGNEVRESRAAPPEGVPIGGWVKKEQEEQGEEGQEVFTFPPTRHHDNTLTKRIQTDDLANQSSRDEEPEVGVSFIQGATRTGGIPVNTRGESVPAYTNQVIKHHHCGTLSPNPSHHHQNRKPQIKDILEGKSHCQSSSAIENEVIKSIATAGVLPEACDCKTSKTCIQSREEVPGLKGTINAGRASGAFRQSRVSSFGECRSACLHQAGSRSFIHPADRLSRTFQKDSLRGELIVEDLEVSEQEESDDNVFYHHSSIDPLKPSLGVRGESETNHSSVDPLKFEGGDNAGFKAFNSVPRENIESSIECQEKSSSLWTQCTVCKGQLVNDPYLHETRDNTRSHNAFAYGLISRIDPSVVEQSVVWRSAMFSRYRSSSMPDHTFRQRDLGLLKASIEQSSEIQHKGVGLHSGQEEWVLSTNNPQTSDQVGTGAGGATGGVGGQENNPSHPISELGSMGDFSPSKHPDITGPGLERHRQRRRSADGSLPTEVTRGSTGISLPCLPIPHCKYRTNVGSRDLSANTTVHSTVNNIDMGFQPSYSAGNYPRRRELVRLSPLPGLRKRSTQGSDELLSPSPEDSAFRPISPSVPNSGGDSLLRPNPRFTRTPSPTLTVRSLSPIPYIRQRANTFSGSGLFSNDRPVFLSPPRSPVRLPRDPIQPSQGSISDLSDKHSQEEAGEESDSFTFQPIPRQRSRTCPENRAWRRRKMAASNRPPTPPPIGTSSSPRNSNIDLASRRLAGLTLSPGMARRSDQLPDLPQLLEDQDPDQEPADGESKVQVCGNGILPLFEVKTKDLKSLTNEKISGLPNKNRLGAVR